jgi:hypothetical protein
MKTRENDAEKMVQITESQLLTLVASKLKDRLLFPEKVEETKKFFANLKYNEL